MGAAERLADDIAYLTTPEFADACRTEDRFFTRERLLTCGALVTSMLCSRGLSSQAEAFGLALDGALPPVSRQAVQKARAKVDPAAIAALAGMHASAVYGDRGAERLLGMVPVAAGGSTAELPTCARTLSDWGSATGRPGGHMRACLGISCAYDPLAGQVLSIEALAPFFDERSRVLGHMERAAEVAGTRELVALLDRGYPSFALMADLSEAGFGFLMRCEPGFMRAEFERCAEAGGDLEVEVELTGDRLSHLRPADRARLRGRVLRVRVALVDAGGGEPERLVASVPASDATLGELAEAYRARWGVETCFHRLKGKLCLESWSGTCRHTLLQDLYAAAYLANVVEDMCREAEGMAAAAGRSTSARGAVGVAASRSFACAALKRGLVRAARRPLDCLWVFRAALEEMSRYTVPIRPGRSYPRSGISHGGKRRASCTHKRCY